MSGVRINRSKLAAYTLSGLFAGLAGLYFAIQTGSGNADPIQAGTYTLNSIAAVVIGGASLFGGTGGAIGTIFGVMVLRSITFCFRVVDTEFGGRLPRQSAAAADVRGPDPGHRGHARRRARLQRQEPPQHVPVIAMALPQMSDLRRSIDRPLMFAGIFIVAILVDRHGLHDGLRGHRRRSSRRPT